MTCKYCKGTGTIPAGYNYLAHECPDCGDDEKVLVSVCCGSEQVKPYNCSTCGEITEFREEEG